MEIGCGDDWVLKVGIKKSAEADLLVPLIIQIVVVDRVGLTL